MIISQKVDDFVLQGSYMFVWWSGRYAGISNSLGPQISMHDVMSLTLARSISKTASRRVHADMGVSTVFHFLKRSTVAL